MKVKIEGNLYLESDAMQFSLVKYTVLKSGKGEGKEIPHNIGYYSSLSHAIKALLRMKIKESTATNLKELSADIKKAEEWIQSLYKVVLDGEEVSV